ncbi:MAG: hypothetical protein RBU37_03250 [Myxococcota bacterium]|nr:hypothetical protein [Myxococcota bacterium]
MSLPIRRSFLLAPAAFLLLLASACGEDAPAVGCKQDKDCERGTICSAVDGKCIAQQCISNTDCGVNRVCYQGSCHRVECVSNEECASFGEGYVCISTICQPPQSCTSREDCAEAGRICNAFTGQCVDPPASCSSDLDCVHPLVCDQESGVCNADLNCTADTDCVEGKYCDVTSGNCLSGCRAGTCAEGETCHMESRTCVQSCTISECAKENKACDASTGQCVERSGKKICEPCTIGVDQCGGPGDRCVSMDTNICTYACLLDGDCPSGYECQPVTTSASACVPIGRKCEGCLLDGCQDNEVCDPDTTACIPKIDICEPCTSAVQCGPGSDCTPFQARNRCLPFCEDGQCPEGLVCGSDGLHCEPTDGICSQCEKQPSSCQLPLKLDEDLCECVQCTADIDCGTGLLCAHGLGQCVPGATHCASDTDCIGMICYGALSEREGVCVQCASNDDCGASEVCTDYKCVVPCQPPLVYDPPSGQCLDPNACRDTAQCVATRGEGWYCDPNSSLCYQPGWCDPADATIAPCAAPSQCLPGVLLPFVCKPCDAATMTGCREGEICLPNLLVPSEPASCVGLDI